MKTIKVSFILAAFIAILFLSGCYFSEFVETRISLGKDGKPTEVTVNYINISSGEEKEADAKRDFEELLKDWHGDNYLLERAREGFVVKSRDVFIANGQINAREHGVIKDINELYEFWVSNGERVMIFDDEDYQLVESNGKILKTPKNTLIVWSEEEKVLTWKQKLSEDVEDFNKNRKLMVGWLKEYLKKQDPS